MTTMLKPRLATRILPSQLICWLGVLACLNCFFADLNRIEADDTIRVLCYNIHYGQGTDGKYDVARLSKVIAAAKPDLVALQEVDVGVKRSDRVHEAQRLSKLTGLEVRFGPTQHYEGGLFGNAVLTRLPILDVMIQPLPYTESTPELVTYPRGAIVVTVKGPDGKPLRFISTHFQHNVPADRVAEAKAINGHFATDSKIPTILAGDMNAARRKSRFRFCSNNGRMRLIKRPLQQHLPLNPAPASTTFSIVPRVSLKWSKPKLLRNHWPRTIVRCLRF